MTHTAPPPTRPLYLIQALRGLAAVFVVLHHAIGIANGYHWVFFTRENGAAGVDIFFIISGFVMAYSSRSLVNKPAAGWTFFKRRAERIYPLYWLLTLAKLSLSGAVRLNNGPGNWQHIVSSFLLLPTSGDNGGMAPILSWGWTLVFEMLFYIIFAVALGLRWKPVALVTPVLAVIAGIAFFVPIGNFPLHGYFNTIVIEFLFGMLLFYAFDRGWKVPQAAGWLLAAVGVGFLLITRNQDFSLRRPMVWGLPAMAIVAAALILEERWGDKLPQWVLKLGDSSYSLYLAHVFVLLGVGAAMAHLHLLPGWILTQFPLIGCVIAAIVGWLMYRWVELPIIGYFKGRRRTAVPSGT